MSNLQWSGILCHAVSQVLERERERERERGEREREREIEREREGRHPLLSRHRN